MVKLIFQEINKVRNIEAKPNFSDEVGRLGNPPDPVVGWNPDREPGIVPRTRRRLIKFKPGI
jgi:hypothetical protein